MGLRRLFGAINDFVARLIGSMIDLLYRAPLSRFISREVLRYGVCGVFNYIVLDAAIYYVVYQYVVGADNYIHLNFVTISPHVFSLLLVFPITFFTGFWLNRYVAFGATESAARSQIVRYGVSILGSIVISYLTLKFLVESLAVWPTFAKVVSSVTTATYSYLMARYFTFRSSSVSAAKK